MNMGLFLQGDLCNEPTFLLAKFNEWISVTRARLKAGPSHPLDILITIATVAVGAFFFLVIASQLPIPWAKIFGKKKEEEDEEEDDEEEEDKADNEDTEEGSAGHAKSEWSCVKLEKTVAVTAPQSFASINAVAYLYFNSHEKQIKFS